LCEWRCGADRLAGEKGHCGAGTAARVFKHRVEMGEEKALVPSHLFYLSGCDLRCAFCIAEENAFDARRGRLLTGPFLQQAVSWGRAQGARTLQWVGGEPTIHLPAILRAMAECDDLPPIVWKSNFHATSDGMDLLDGVVDVYLADLKFGNDGCAARIAGIPNYFQVVTRNLLQAERQGTLIVRHLLLPGHFECCFEPIAGWLRSHMPDVRFSIRDGYLSRWQAARHGELARTLGPNEHHAARELAAQLGLRVVE
jgi:putative pyruvate formate lyase activating enzyme